MVARYEELLALSRYIYCISQLDNYLANMLARGQVIEGGLCFLERESLVDERI